MYMCQCLSACACLCHMTCLFSSSLDGRSPRTCSLYTARCSGRSRSGCAALTVFLSAAGQPGPSPPRRLFARLRSSWWSDGYRRCWSRARPASQAWRTRDRGDKLYITFHKALWVQCSSLHCPTPLPNSFRPGKLDREYGITCGSALVLVVFFSF